MALPTGLSGGKKQKNGTYSMVTSTAPTQYNVNLGATQKKYGFQTPNTLANTVSQADYNTAMTGINSQKESVQRNYLSDSRSADMNHFTALRSQRMASAKRGLNGGIGAGLVNQANFAHQSNIQQAVRKRLDSMNQLDTQGTQADIQRVKNQLQLKNQYNQEQLGIAFQDTTFNQQKANDLSTYRQGLASNFNDYYQFLAGHSQETSQFAKTLGLDKAQFNYQKTVSDREWKNMSPSEKAKMSLQHSYDKKLAK